MTFEGKIEKKDYKNVSSNELKQNKTEDEMELSPIDRIILKLRGLGPAINHIRKVAKNSSENINRRSTSIYASTISGFILLSIVYYMFNPGLVVYFCLLPWGVVSFLGLVFGHYELTRFHIAVTIVTQVYLLILAILVKGIALSIAIWLSTSLYKEIPHFYYSKFLELRSGMQPKKESITISTLLTTANVVPVSAMVIFVNDPICLAILFFILYLANLGLLWFMVAFVVWFFADPVQSREVNNSKTKKEEEQLGKKERSNLEGPSNKGDLKASDSAYQKEEGSRETQNKDPSAPKGMQDLASQQAEDPTDDLLKYSKFDSMQGDPLLTIVRAAVAALREKIVKKPRDSTFRMTSKDVCAYIKKTAVDQKKIRKILDFINTASSSEDGTGFEYAMSALEQMGILWRCYEGNMRDIPFELEFKSGKVRFLPNLKPIEPPTYQLRQGRQAVLEIYAKDWEMLGEALSNNFQNVKTVQNYLMKSIRDETSRCQDLMNRIIFEYNSAHPEHACKELTQIVADMQAAMLDARIVHSSGEEHDEKKLSEPVNLPKFVMFLAENLLNYDVTLVR